MVEAAQQFSLPGNRQSVEEKNLYNTSYFSIFFRNFIAGAARALGGIILYLVFFTVVVRVFTVYIYPQVKPYLDTFLTLGELSKMQMEKPQDSTYPKLEVTREQIDQVIQ